MRLLVKMAARNLLRNKLRTIIAIVVIAFAVMMVVVLRGFVLGVIDSMFELHLQYKSGHIKIINKKYEGKQRLLSLNYPVDGFNNKGLQQMQEKLREVKGVKRTIPRIKFGAAVSKNEELITMMGWGVRPRKEVRYTNIKDYLIQGRMINEGEGEILLGKSLLARLNARVGEKITIVYTTAWGSFKGSTVKIVGALESGLKLIDEKSLYIPFGEAQHMLALSNQATELLIETYNYRRIGEIMPKVNAIFQARDKKGQYLAKRWDQGNSIIEYLKVGEKVYNLVYILVIILASLVVINTLLMIVKERTSEIGMLSALGLKGSEVLVLFLLEGFALGIIASFLGVCGGGIITKILSEVGIDYSAALADVEADLLIRPVIYPTFQWSNLFYSFGLGVIITSITAVIPAKKAADLKPTEALKQ